MTRRTPIEIESLEALAARLDSGQDLAGTVLQGLDLAPLAARLATAGFAGATLLGCRGPKKLMESVLAQGALVFPDLPDLPYHPYRPRLYTPEELYEGFDPGHPETYRRTLDARVYRHFMDSGGAHSQDLLESLAQRLHDHAVTDALDEFLDGEGRRSRTVAVMGGHSVARGTPEYLAAARLGRELARRGFLVATGGGPGAMEAAHLGAFTAGRDLDELGDAIGVLALAPKYTDASWLARAFEVRARAPCLPPTSGIEAESLGVPTWHYGHEPPNPFATRIAKYFQNSVREEGLTAMALAGVVFTPGSAGTVQEVFQDACQNHYESYGRSSPMVLFGVDFWTRTLPVVPLLTRLAEGRGYRQRITVTDSVDEAISAIAAGRT